jgi:hypothetical protein
MKLRILLIFLIAASACGPSTEVEPDGFTPPEFVPVANCLTSPALQGATEAEVQACGGEPCAQAVEHTDPAITLSWRLYCAEARCSEDCYWHVRVYFENGKVSYTRVRRPGAEPM